MERCNICNAEIHSDVFLKDLNGNCYCNYCGNRIMKGELDLKYFKDGTEVKR